MQIYTVSQITQYIKNLFDVDTTLQDLWVEGEISNCVQSAAGHIYFTLKDASAQLRCVLWRSQAARLEHLPTDGKAVVVHGHTSVYEAHGSYQLYVDLIQPLGAGALFVQFQALKDKLQREGLFAAERKRPLPPFPRRLGVVTSPVGAAIRDILHVLRRRYPLVEVVLAPTLVQGDEAPLQIVAAIEALNTHVDVDAIIVARGGGSLEELWAFNDERVARAIFASRVPVISGVGHETDYTIADFVADVRAPTPSAAAEIAAPDKTELEHKLKNLLKTAANHLFRKNLQKRTNLQQFTQKLASLNPIHRINELRQKTDWIFSSILQKITQNIASRKQRVDNLQNALEMLSPQRVLARGFSIVRKDGSVITNSSNLAKNDSITIEFFKGSATATVEKTEGDRN